MAKQKVAIPENTEQLLELARQIAAKHAADGASSILNSLQDYSWNSLAATIPTTLAKHLEAESLRRQSDKAYEVRNQLLPPLVKAVKATRTLLLGAFRATPSRLGDWGFEVSMAGGKPKVVIPENVEQLLDLAKLIVARHTADGATSILNSLQDYSWSTLAPTLQTCLDKHHEAETLRLQTDKAYEARNLLLPPINNAVRASRDLLLGAFMGTPRRLGDWGFDVSQSSGRPKPPPTA